MSPRACVLLLALAVCAAAWPGAARAYDLPQVCMDALALQRQGLAEDQERIAAMYAQCLGGDLSPGNRAIVHNNRGHALNLMGDKAGALEEYSEALRLNPEYADAYYNRASVLDDMGDLAGAIADYDKAIALNPGHAMAYGNRAFVYKKLGETEKARADAARALELDPTVKVPTF